STPVHFSVYAFPLNPNQYIDQLSPYWHDQHRRVLPFIARAISRLVDVFSDGCADVSAKEIDQLKNGIS
ncbi:MAG: hypothetical protein MI867_27370, partial [Pseudomonadales bacterium]|nr:hypothetical protein [Pseudomonadales bacterium]